MSAFGKRRTPNDECYTNPGMAEYIVTKYFYLLENKRIILPCDGECSELYKACLRHGLTCDIAQDMYGVDYSNYDIVFTNPPFSKTSKWCRWLNEKGIKYLLIAPWSTAVHGVIYNLFFHIEDLLYSPSLKGPEKYLFNTPSGETKHVHVCLITNLEEGRNIIETKPDIRIEPIEFTTYRGIYSDMLMCK